MRLKVARMESLGTRMNPSSGESKSSMRKTAEATQIAQVTIDRYTTALRGESKPKTPKTTANHAHIANMSGHEIVPRAVSIS
jgi:hypothetical protein